MGSVALALVVVLIAAMFFTALLNWVIERVAYRPLRGSFRLAPLISAIGMSIVLSNFVQVAQGPTNKPIPPLFNHVLVLIKGDGNEVNVSYMQIVIWLVTAVLLLAFWFVVSKTALGRAQRACEQDPKMAALVGIDVNRTISMTFVIAAALAAVAGTLYLMHYGVITFSDGFTPGVKAFTAAVLGGIGSLPGAVVGGLLIGLIERCGRRSSHRLQGRGRLFDPCDHDDLPAAGPAWPAGCRKGLKVMEGGTSAWRARLARAAGATALTALVAFGLFLPLIGFRTVPNIRNQLTLETRWPLLLTFVLITAAARLLWELAPRERVKRALNRYIRSLKVSGFRRSASPLWLDSRIWP